jgi:putative heme-binding domain-containing protein
MVIHNRPNHAGMQRTNCARAVAAVVFLIGINIVIAETAVAQERPASLTNILKQTDVSELVAQAMQQGDVDRGKSIFHREKLGCVKCHVASQAAIEKGLRSIGPDQRNVGDRLRPEQIVEAVLFPNKAIAKGYDAFVVVTDDGKVHKGVLVRQSAAEVVLVDPEKPAPIRIARAGIDAMQKARSAMPDALVDQLANRQEFLDLIRFLTEQKASATGSPVMAKKALLIKEVPSGEGRLPVLAVGRPDGICYSYNPNQFRFESIWKGPLGWQQEDGRFTLNQATAEPFHIREKPWKIDVGKGQFDFDWLGHEVNESGVVLRYTLTEKLKGKPANKPARRVWTVEESIEVISLLRQRLRFRIRHPDQSSEVLTYWLRQTNFRSVSSNGQQAQRNQLEFLKPEQSEFFIDLSRRKSGQTMPRGYSLSRITGPELEPPYLFEPTGFSFAKDGTAFVSTRAGGIWRYRNKRWNQFADGLQETQGVQVAPNGRDVYTMQKPELTLLRDTDGDGQADLYSSVANRFRFTGQYHEFAYGPVINSAGELFFSTGLSSSGHHEAKKSGSGQMSSALGYRGWVMKVDKKGELKPFASGLRSPAGIGMNADDELFITDNQGDWVASSYLGHVENGDFLGHPAALWDRKEFGITPRQLNYKTVDARVESVPPLDEAQFRTERKRPAVWLIHGDLTNSPGNPSFCPPQGFGPFEGQAFIADISHRAIVRVALEKVNGVYQGAVFPFIRPLGSASYSTCFDPQGRLWVGSVGRGWTTGEPIIEVISHDKEKPPFEVHHVELKPDGFDIHLTLPLSETAVPIEQVAVRRFHYLYWAEYGSDRQDNVKLPVERLTVSDDRKTLSINVPVSKDKIYEIDLGPLQSANGVELQNNFAFYTVNELVP